MVAKKTSRPGYFWYTESGEDMAGEKKTMTLNLTEAEMAVLEKLSLDKDLSKTAILRQALRLYQLVDNRLAQGDTLFLEDKEKKNKSELMVL
jgi:hypothetical protein